MKSLYTIVLFLCLGHALCTRAAEEKVAAAQSAQLSKADAQELKEYTDLYQEFKKAVLDQNIEAALRLLGDFQFQYGRLPYNVQKVLYQQIPDDEISYRLNVKPSEPTFFLQALALLGRMQQKAEPPFPPLSESKQNQPPTPPMFLSKPRKITDLNMLTSGYTYLNNTLLNSDPAKAMNAATNNNNFAVMEYILQKKDISQLDPDRLLPHAITHHHMMDLLFKYGMKKEHFKKITDTFIDRLPDMPFETVEILYDLYGQEEMDRFLTNIPKIFLQPRLVKMLIEKKFNVNKKVIQLILDRAACTRDWHPALTLSLQYILESEQLKNNPALKEQLINPQGSKPLCNAAALRWKEGAELLIKHGAHCTSENYKYYKDFLEPLIREVEKERAAEAEKVLHAQLPETQSSLHPLPRIVKEYIMGEEPAKAEPIVSTIIDFDEVE